jgi:hypothetical protein
VVRRKARPAVEEYETCVKELERSFRRHAEILARGTEDPFYPDGVNANLVRNQILYYKRRLEDVCARTLLPLPEVYHRPTPDEVDDWYMAPGSRAMRCRRGEVWPLAWRGMYEKAGKP